MIELKDSIDSKRAGVRLQWGVQIPLRDGICLNATLYLPQDHIAATPAIVTLTPYTAQLWHDFAVYFAAHGYPFLCVDVRGRGNSPGDFRPFIQEAADGHDVVEWLGQQPYCNGQVTMWGGSYAAYAQWAAAKEFPSHLATFVPVASPYPSVDMTMRNNIFQPYLMKWLTLVSGRTLQDRLFFNCAPFWGAQFRRWFEAGVPYQTLDAFLGNPSAVFQEWVSHPQRDSYWDRYNPSAEQYANLSIPILTITAIYDGDQPGALMHHRQHLQNASPQARAKHYLVIGPWDHFGTRTPKAEFCGLKIGSAGLIDIQQLHLDWYAWTMRGGPKPPFLKKNVAYYVMGAEAWRYADTLEEVTARSEPFYLRSGGHPTDIFQSGSLTSELAGKSEPDLYIYDPRDAGHAELESTADPENMTDQRMLHALVGRQLIYHSAPFEKDLEISGFFKFVAWLAIDQPDTDFRVSVYEIGLDGSSILLSSDSMRARYRESIREAKLIRTREPLRYEFERFTFVSRLIRQGSRLRLVLGPINSIYSEKNYNSGRVVAEECLKDARVVTVKLFHDKARPSVLHVPFGRQEA